MKLLFHCVAACLLFVAAAIGETPIKSEFVTAHPAAGPGLPPYLLYRHFLGWVNSVGGPDARANASDLSVLRKVLPSHVELGDTDLKFLRSEAFVLSSELQARDSKAALIVAAYRKQATLAIQKAAALPPEPAELRQLQQERTALLVQHYAKMRAGLSTTSTLSLDNYLRNGCCR